MGETFISYLVAKRFVEHLTKAMTTDIDIADPSRVDTVKMGRVTETPTKKNITLAVIGGSLTDPELRDGIVVNKDFDQIGVFVYPREIGGGSKDGSKGGQFWWRRGEVRINCYFTQGLNEEDTVAQVAYEVYGRLLANIENVVINDLVDDFGERAKQMYCFASNFMESGGGSKFIWRGSAKWQFLTSRR